MTVLQVSLLIVGVILLLASFFVTERLSKKEVDELSRLSSAQLQKVVDKEISGIEDKVTDIVGEAIDKAADELQRPMEKLSNEKIMAINEYSDTVMDQINKTHSEIVFLYNMMNDKQDEMKGILASIERNKAQLREMTDRAVVIEKKTESAIDSYSTGRTRASEERPEESGNALSGNTEPEPEEEEYEGFETGQDLTEEIDPSRIDPGFVFRDRDEEQPLSSESVDDNDEKSALRRKILEMYEEGLTAVEIGKRLRCGVGEVKLVIDLANRG